MMNKIALTSFLVALLTSCGIKDRIEKQNKARANADFIMQNLGKGDVISQFPEKYFPRNQFVPFLSGLAKTCDFQNKRGKFVDFFTMVDNGRNKTAFIYEYILKCDSLRFIYMYDLDEPEPELYKLRIEGIEQKNEMIVDPSKQLLYEKK